MTAPVYGATPDDWTHFDLLLGLTADLLPVVSNPHAEISPDSKMSDLGKVPSRYNRARKVAGISAWTKHAAKGDEITRWSKEPDYGICLQCREVRALDIDVADPAAAMPIRIFIQMFLNKNLPFRYRTNSGKSLMAFRLPGEFSKRRFKVEGGVIEFLATGQQFIAVGTHPSGVRYEWAGGLPDDFPALTAEQFETLWTALLDQFAIEDVKPDRVAPRGADTTPAAPIDPTTLAAALAAIPNDGDGLAYDDWLQTVMAMHYETGASAEGLEMVRAWSARSAKHRDDEIETEWGRIKGASHSGKVVTGRTILHMARAHGWTESCEQDFDVVIPPPGAPREKPAFLRDGKGAVLVTMTNMVLAIERPDICGMQIGYDQFRDEIMFSEDGGANWAPFRDADYSRVRINLEACDFKPPSKEITRDAVMLVAERNTFDSAQVWLNRLEWDGVPRVAGFLPAYLATEDTPYTQAVGCYLWTALAGRVLDPGCKADMAPVLVGKQGARKSSAVAAMVPSTDFFAEVSFGEKEDDLSRKMRGRLIAELAELKGLHSRESDHVKAWITKRYEDWTPKYREFNTKFPRRLVFVGTTNRDEFLSDDTGNRRWLPVRVGDQIDVDGIAKDRLQLWAEARAMWLESGVAYHRAEALANDVHAEYMIRDAWFPFVQKWLEEEDAISGEKPSSREFLRVSEVLQEALRMDAKNCKRADEMRVGAVLRDLGYFRVRKMADGVREYLYFPPLA